MKKRLVTLLLALTLTATSFTGCGAKETATETSDNSVHTAASSATAGDTAAEYPEYVDEDASSYEPMVEAEAVESYKSNSNDRGNSSAKVETSADATLNYGVEEYWDYAPGSETYANVIENGFKDARRNPLSTFGADVDTASYSNMRRMIEYGEDIDDLQYSGIRVEELVNYFPYDYKRSNKDIFSVDATVADCPWNRDNKLLILGITTKEIKETERPDSNIVFLVDISGSMSTKNKLPLLKDAMDLLVENLTENDTVSIVTYASGTGVALEGARGDDKRKIMRAFSDLEAGGATNGEGGIQLAYSLAEDYFIKDGNNRVIIASDGDFNVGASSRDDLYDLISEKKDSGIFLSVLGFGMGNYNDVTMETLADSGNGNYAYIDNLSEAKKVLVDEMSSTLYTVAKDTKFQIEFNPELVSEYRQIGYENRALKSEDFTDDTKDGGELGSGHQVTVMYELNLNDEYEGKTDLKYQKSSAKEIPEGSEWCTLSIAYKEPDKDKSEYLECPIGVTNYTTDPTDDFIFAAAVAQAGMAMNNSEYLADFTSNEEAVEDAIDNISELDLNDEYREEFLVLMMELVSYRSDRDDRRYIEAY